MRHLARACLVLLSLSLATSALPGAAPAAAGFDQGWMEPGMTLSLQATLGATLDPEAAAAAATEAPLTVVVHAVDDGSITLDLIHAGTDLVVQQATFSRASRSGPGGFAVLWVDDADVAAGQAWIGDRLAILVMSTPAFHLFASGGQNFYYDSVFGLLLRGEDLDSGSVLALTGMAQGVVPTPTAQGSPGTVGATPSAAAPVEPLPLLSSPQAAQAEAAAGNWGIIVACTGKTTGVLGGSYSCPTATFNMEDRFSVYEDGALPYLGAGTMTSTLSDAFGVYRTTTCRATLLVSTTGPAGCTATLHRSVVERGTHTVSIGAQWSHCLDAFTGFSCTFTMRVKAWGFVTCGSGCTYGEV